MRLRRTHQLGCAARSARCGGGLRARSRTAPKQVAPEPDMRASRQPGVAQSARARRAITGCSAIAGGFEIVALRRDEADRSASRVASAGDRAAAVGRAAARIAERREHILVGTATPGLTSTAGSVGNRERRGQHLADAAHHARRADRGRPARRRRSPRAASSRRGSSSARPLARASSRSAAAASDEPPPSPAATGRRFVEREAAELAGRRRARPARARP